MTDTTISDALYFPQDEGTGVPDGSEDFAIAGFISLLSKYKGSGSYIGETETGASTMGFSAVDTANDQVDIDTGYAYVMESGNTVPSSGTTYDTTLPNSTPYVVVLPSTVSNLQLDIDTSNDLWLAVDPTSNNSVYIRHGSGLSAPPDPSVKLGTVNTSDGSTSEVNRRADGSFGPVSISGDIDSSMASIAWTLAAANANAVEIRDASTGSTYLDLDTSNSVVNVPDVALQNRGSDVLTQADNVTGAADTIYMVADQGADDTGATAVDTEFSNAISNASEGDTIRFEGGGHFLLNNKHQIGKGITLDLRGATLELSGVLDDWQIQFIPTTTRSGALSNKTEITANVSEGETTIPVGSTAGYARGDYLLLNDDAAIDLTPGLSSAEQHIQWGVVESVDGTATTIDIGQAAHRDFTNAGAGVSQVAEAQMIEDPKVLGGTVIGGGDYAFQFAFCRNPRFEDVTVEDHLSYALMFSECIDGIAENCTVRHPQTFNSGEGEFIYIRRSANTTIRDCEVDKCRRGIDMIAGSYNTFIENCRIYNFSHNGISVHQSNPVGDIHVVGGEIRGADNSTHNNQGNGISGSSNCDLLVVEGVTIQAPGAGINIDQPSIISGCKFIPGHFTTTSSSAVDIDSSDVRIENCLMDERGVTESWDGYPVRIASTSAIEDIYVDATIHLTGAPAGILIQPQSAGATVENVTLRGSIRDHGSQKAMEMYTANARLDHIDISVDCHGIGDHGIAFRESEGVGHCRIHDCSIYAARHPINLWGSSGSGVTTHYAASTNAEALHLSNCYFRGDEATEPVLDIDRPLNHLFIADCYIDVGVNASGAITTRDASTTDHFSNNQPLL